MKKVLLVMSLITVSSTFVCLGMERKNMSSTCDHPQTRYWFKNVDEIRSMGLRAQELLFTFIITGEGKEDILHLMRDRFEMQRPIPAEELDVFFGLVSRVAAEISNSPKTSEKNRIICRTIHEQGPQVLIARFFDFVMSTFVFWPEIFCDDQDIKFKEQFAYRVEDITARLGRIRDLAIGHLEMIRANPLPGPQTMSNLTGIQMYWKDLCKLVGCYLGIQPGLFFDKGLMARLQNKESALLMATHFDESTFSVALSLGSSWPVVRWSGLV